MGRITPSVLGSMNEMRFHIEVDVEDPGGLDGVDLADLPRRLNRTPGALLATGIRSKGLART